MNRSEFKTRKSVLLAECNGFYNKAMDIGDVKRAEKIMMLAKKLHHEEIVIAFCGHFSAGKSAMINYLAGESILPSSPIPTSANLIALHSGGYKPVRVTTEDDQVFELEPPLNESSISLLGKEGLSVKRIDIWKESTLAEGITLLDTPGIDSVDDAHKRSTESAIHLADLLFYVMDYNHVQSEMNFEYIKQMSRHNRKIYAVINQIDKHREEELTFDTFRQSVERAFFEWGARPEKFFYTSLRRTEMHENQSDELKEEISKMTANKYSLLIDSVASSLSVLKEEMTDYLKEEAEEITDAYSSIISSQDIEQQEELFKLAEESEAGQVVSSDDWSDKFDRDMNKMLQSSYLMPSEVRAVAEKYLESVQEKFKVGIMFTAKKTQEEKQARENELRSSLSAVIDEQLIWHAKALIYRHLELSGVNKSEWTDEIESLSIDDPIKLAQKNIKPGAGYTGEALLNYCDALADDFRKKIKTQMLEIKNHILQQFEDLIEENTLRKSAEYTELIKKVNVLKQLKTIETNIHGLKNIDTDQENANKWIGNWSEEGSVEKISSLDHLLSNEDSTHEEIKESESIDTVDRNESELLKKSLQLAEAVSHIRGFEKQSEILFDQADRLKNKKYTVALFGAFSAGKSSFANALLGDKILPVSPNPTTASINKIFPPDHDHPDQSVIVHFKKEADLLADLQEASGINHIKALEEMADKLPDLIQRPNEISESKKSFIRAFLKGWKNYHPDLGTEKEVSMEDFEGFVSNEYQSCFVEAIDLYADSSIAANGITLVDTPGADSVNARHTDVSFDFIRNSDAILFVTYFNHAFARADREFLIQMGRVKDSFEHDKMFFIVNAVDLAESEEEKQEVIQYVKKQLQTFGVRQPKIFGVSSLQALSHHGESGIEEFNSAFTTFIDQELDVIVIKNTADYYDQTISRMKSLLNQARADEDKKAIRKLSLEQLTESIDSYFNDEYLESVQLQADQELKELLHYVHQRVFYRFSDFFKESFNPSGFNGYSSKIALSKAISELIEIVKFDFIQEFKVVNYRMEQLIRKLYQSELERIWDQVKVEFPEGIKPVSDVKQTELLTFNQSFEDMKESDFNKELSMFKNTKSFFEKNEKKFMQHALEERFKEKSKEEISLITDQISSWVSSEVIDIQQKLFTAWKKDLKEQITSTLNGLYSEEFAAEIERALEKVKSDES
ncbi:dynamin family protein [Jeotgalibacillus terrae]|uniref:Dynamin family protein n=1 Tax=Jeotgalibacillus terrae TaxID=587735 RepID=A0ABW5ZLY3_9BACL|nr:dynamin family protein [Jeotgalibacillus terrae]MBM7577388.1 GTPase Era involved in 16S rRNA processing [Jeotgalibacillus terrae]